MPAVRLLPKWCNRWLAGDVVGGEANDGGIFRRCPEFLHVGAPPLLFPSFAILQEKRGGTVKKIDAFFFFAGLLLALSMSLQPAEAQTLTSGTVIGTVTDPSGAAVLDATVVLRNKATNGQFTQNSNSAGQYTFANVAPGEYQVTVKKAGFRTADVAALTVDVAKSYTLDFKMELGQVAEVVQVEAGARVELQTTDATVGNVLAGLGDGELSGVDPPGE